MESSFNKDLHHEQLLGSYLDEIYCEIFDPVEIKINRITDYDKQNSGIDLTIHHIQSSKIFNVDEKAQLDYVNSDLTTFAFEVSYLKQGEYRQGWLFDKSKVTHYYFLVTAIRAKKDQDISNGIKSVKIHSINRLKLIQLLEEKGLSQRVIERYDNEIRNGRQFDAIEIEELNYTTEGRFYYSKTNKNESPINLVMKLSYLVKSGVGKRIN